MCLGIPGKIISVYEDQELRMGLVDYNGARREVCLVGVPDAVQGDYVIVHAGFAISKVDEKEALETISMLDEIDENGM